MTPGKHRMEFLLGAFGALFLALVIPWRRPLSWSALDAVVLIAGFGAAFAAFDRGRATVAYPLATVLLAYFALRLAWRGLRGPGSAPAWSPPPLRLALVLLVVLGAVRAGYALWWGDVNDVGYASVFGADSILHGYPLYAQDTNHLDTYGPIGYLAYVPASLLFPMNANWVHDGLLAARVTTAAVDIGTLGLLVALGRRLRTGRAGTRLGVGMALLFAACPWTLFGVTQNTNDGLVALLLTATLLTMGSAPLRGAMLGLAAAAKISPLALLPLVAGGGRPSGGAAARCVAACVAVVVVAVLAYVPDGGFGVVWHETVAFQLHRRAFQSLWGQHPELASLQTALKAATALFAAALVLVPRRRDLAQIAALAATVVVGLQLTVQFWSFFYLAWLAPLLIVAVAASSADEVAERRLDVRLDAGDLQGRRVGEARREVHGDRDVPVGMAIGVGEDGARRGDAVDERQIHA
jgi:hypothetical protein